NGGYVESSGAGDASDNIVTISGGSVNSVNGGSTAHGNAMGNTVTIKDDAQINVAVFGGFAPDGDATDNRVIIKGSPTLGGRLTGGYAPNGTSNGNVLEVHSVGLTATNVKAFQQYDFILPTGTADGDV